MLVRLGYVAMSVHLKNASPSQTMTYAQFQKLDDREAQFVNLKELLIQFRKLFTFIKA